MWSYSHPPTPGQQPSFVCYWDPEGAERAIRRKFGHISIQKPGFTACNNDTICIIHDSTVKAPQEPSDAPSELQEYTDNNGGDSKDRTPDTMCAEGRSDGSSPESQKASDESSLSGPSWRMQRGLGEFRCAAHDANSSSDKKTGTNKQEDMDKCSIDTDKLDHSYAKESRLHVNTGTTDHLQGFKSLKAKHQEPDLCNDEITPLPGRRYGQVFAQMNVQDGDSNYLSALMGPEPEKSDYFGDVDLAPPPFNARTTSKNAPERPSMKYCGSKSTNTLDSIGFKTDIFGKEIPVASRPKYRHYVSSGLIQKLRREARSEETDPFIEGYNPASRAPNLPTITDTATSALSRTTRSFKPQIFRAPASAPVIRLRRSETAAASDISRDGIGRNRKTQRRAIRSSEASDTSLKPLDDATSGSPPATKEGVLRKYWTLGLKSPLLFPIYLGTSKRSRLFGNSSPSLSTDGRDFHDSSESQPTSALDTSDSGQASLSEMNDNIDYFRIRSNRLSTDDEDDDEEGGKSHVDIPDHLPSSPLCPLNPKYRGVHLAECPLHGKRRIGLSVVKI